jgi:hypothetical protein
MACLQSNLVFWDNGDQAFPAQSINLGSNFVHDGEPAKKAGANAPAFFVVLGFAVADPPQHFPALSSIAQDSCGGLKCKDTIRYEEVMGSCYVHL